MNIIEWADGNPGAMTFLMQLLGHDNAHELTLMMNTLKVSQIRGTDLYVLWSDLCDRDISTVYCLLRDCPQDILIDACSRQDYSGQEIVKDYIVHVNDL